MTGSELERKRSPRESFLPSIGDLWWVSTVVIAGLSGLTHHFSCAFFPRTRNILVKLLRLAYSCRFFLLCCVETFFKLSPLFHKMKSALMHSYAKYKGHSGIFFPIFNLIWLHLNYSLGFYSLFYLVLQKTFIKLWNTEQNMIVLLASISQVSKESQADDLKYRCLKYRRNSLYGVEGLLQ